jgi:hypothetical protein
MFFKINNMQKTSLNHGNKWAFSSMKKKIKNRYFLSEGVKYAKAYLASLQSLQE